MTHLTRSDAVGIEAIAKIKEVPRGTEHHLRVHREESKRTGRDAESSELRHNTERKLYRDLSRYYPRQTLRLWERRPLLLKSKDGCIQSTGDIPLTTFLSVLEDLEDHPELLPPPK